MAWSAANRVLGRWRLATQPCRWQSSASLSSYSPQFGGDISWFPGHMAKAIDIVKLKVAECDAVLEVRDARVPLSSTTPVISDIIGTKPHTVIMNKADLAAPRLQQLITHRLEAEGKDVIFSSGTSTRQITKLLARLQDEAKGAHRPAGTVMLVIGIPNVGKSTVIRGLKHACGLAGRGKRGRGPTKGRKAGVTRYVSAFAVSKDPPLFLMDSPGILVPKIEDARQGVKLALTGALPDAAVPQDELAHYLICHARDTRSKQFKRALGLEEVPQDSWQLLGMLAQQWGLLAEGGVPDTDAAALQLVTLFRLGKLGRYTLDDIDAVAL